MEKGGLQLRPCALQGTQLITVSVLYCYLGNMLLTIPMFYELLPVPVIWSNGSPTSSWKCSLHCSGWLRHPFFIVCYLKSNHTKHNVVLDIFVLSEI